jgi:hypothetical protein
MAHLKNLALENFRVFKEKREFEFAPITILTGTNSSGKSSLIRALQTLNNSSNHNLFFRELIFNSEVNIGTFSNVVNCNSDNEYITFSIPFPLDYFDDEFRIQLSFGKSKNGLKNRGTITKIEIINEVNGSVFLMFEKQPFDINTTDDGFKKDLDDSTVEYLTSCNTILDVTIDLQYIVSFLHKKINDFFSEPEVPSNEVVTKALPIDLLLDEAQEMRTKFATPFYDNKGTRSLRLETTKRKELSNQSIHECSASNLFLKYYVKGEQRLGNTNVKIPGPAYTKQLSEEIRQALKKRENIAIDELNKSTPFYYNSADSDFNSDDYDKTKEFLISDLQWWINDKLKDQIYGYASENKVYFRRNELDLFGKIVIEKCLFNNMTSAFLRLKLKQICTIVPSPHQDKYERLK